MAEKVGLPPGIAVAVGAFDAHMGAVGSGVKPGTLVKIIGTSTCDITVWPLDQPLEDIPGLCGIVPGSVIPGMYGLEAGQSAVGRHLQLVRQARRRAGLDTARTRTSDCRATPSSCNRARAA